MDAIKKLGKKELQELQHIISLFITEKAQQGDSEKKKRKSKRFQITIPATCDIEREKEFFDKAHKITILEMSNSGLVFTIPTIVLQHDLLTVYFRSFSDGVEKKITCVVVRATEEKAKMGTQYRVAVKAVGKDEVYKYKIWLRKRSGDSLLI